VILSLHEDPEVRSRIAAADRLLVFLDFDGTLTPTVNDPASVRLDERTRDALTSLAEARNVHLAILSGRSMDDLRARVGIDSVIYGANHGLQINGPGIDFVDSRALSVRQDLQDLLTRIDPRVPAFRGAWVEAKELTVSVHHRSCTEDDAARLREFLLEALGPFAGRLELTDGKKVFEILPQTFWNKGAAAHWILMRPENYTALVFSFGDDCTDEHLFRTLPEAITVKIGDGRSTAARYHMDGPEQVCEFLVWLGHNMPEYPVAA